MVNRRAFVKSGAMALFATGMGGVPAFIAAAAEQKKTISAFRKTKTLVCIFQRGAMDGLMAVTPYTDPHLKLLRPDLYMSPAQTEGRLFDLDGKFGLHPALGSLHPFFVDGRMAVVHGVGSPNKTRSHFDAQDYMESGTPFSKSTPSGWLNRAVGLTGHDASPFAAVGFTPTLPRSLQGAHDALAVGNLEDFAIQLRGNPVAGQMASASFEQLYDQASNPLLKQSGKESFDAIRMIDPKLVKQYRPLAGVEYPSSPFGRSLKQIALLIKMDVGLEVAFAESGGWDTHFNQGTLGGTFARNLKDFSDSIAAFWKDLDGYQDEVTVMTMTEFGRTVRQNGTGGTDHGRGSCLFVLGNQTLGGKMYSNMGSLAPEALEDKRDLPVTTDFRAVFSEVAGHHLGISDTKALFPGWEGNNLPLMR